jgi:amidohydrolase
MRQKISRSYFPRKPREEKTNMSEYLKEPIQKLAKSYHKSIVAIRRHLHSHPELSFQEYRTAQFIGKTLKELGIEVQEGIANTGLVATIRGRNAAKHMVALRADIDALPIQEENQVHYKSQVPGVMHACGHDVHTASLIGTAQILHALKEEFEGTFRLIFQPAEEKAPGGAIAMIQEGVLAKPVPACILGQHVAPMLAAGKIAFTKGIVMASADEIYITVQGKGGHAASPHLAVDPILIAAHIIVALQQLVSRNTDPLSSVVLSICQMHGGEATNVIPDKVYLSGTLRTIDESVRAKAHETITALCQNIAKAMGGICIVDIGKGYPSTYNNPGLTERALVFAKQYMGADNVVELPLTMGGEDFGYYAQQVPGCFYLLGVQNEAQGICSLVHTPTFNIDEKALEIGAGLMAWLAIQELNHT